jgi:hypothetical protein
MHGPGNPSQGTVSGQGQPGTHWGMAAVDGEVATGSQEVRAASGRVFSSGGVVSCGKPSLSSDGGAPWSGSTAASPAKSVQGKDS